MTTIVISSACGALPACSRTALTIASMIPAALRDLALRDNGLNLPVAELYLPEVHGLRDAVGINNDDVAGQELCHILLIGKILHDAQDESAGRQPIRRTGPGKVKRLSCPALQ